MTPNEFCFWFHGAIELSEKSIAPSKYVYNQIKHHLKLVEFDVKQPITNEYVCSLTSALNFCNYETFLILWESIVENLEKCFKQTYGDKE